LKKSEYRLGSIISAPRVRLSDAGAGSRRSNSVTFIERHTLGGSDERAKHQLKTALSPNALGMILRRLDKEAFE
jgi:hypothetical protein